MERVSEQWSKANARSQGRTDANLSNDSNHLGGIPADEYATKEYVQEYHDTKEGNLKDYVDRQDQSILNEAKEYTNSQIRNQDFSDFAKLTDVQALDNKLSEEIEEGLATQKSYTDSKTQAIVDDVNANFQDVENSINTLNGNMNELFQSVSSGKGVVAEAITDKGVPTSASDSFNTMATNIRAIPTSSGGGGGEGGSGEDDPNYVNTGDATATAADILSGKTAYVKGKKIYGNLVYTDVGSGTIYNPDNPYPDKAEVELIYAEKDGEIELNTATHDTYKVYDISSDKRLMIAWDEDEEKLKTFLRGTTILGDGYAQVKNDNGELVTPEYTFTDLGITGIENYQLGAIKFSIMNAEQDKSGYECRVALLFRKTVETSSAEAIYKCFIFRVSTYDGEITSENESYIAGVEGSTGTYIYYNRWEFESDTKLTNACSSSLYIRREIDLVWSPDNYTLAIMVYCNQCSYLKIYRFKNSSFGSEENYDSVVELKYSNPMYYGMWDGTYRQLQFANNDRIVNVIRYGTYGGSRYISDMLIFDEDMNLLKKYTEDTNGSGGMGATAMAITSDGLYCLDNNRVFYSVTINYTTGDVEVNQLNSLPTSYTLEEAVFTKDNKFLIIREPSPDSRTKIFSVDFINQIYELIGSSNNYDNLKILSNLKNIELPGTKQLIETVLDKEELIGLKYQGQMFYNNVFNAGRFTAGQGDVRKGKTFIGWQGIPETGTMEVTEVEEQ